VKKWFLVFIALIGLLSFAHAQDNTNKLGKLGESLAGLKVKHYTEKPVTSKMISKLYLFNENGLIGGAAVATFEEYKTDFFVIVVKVKDQSLIKFVDVMDENALRDMTRMKELREALAALNGRRLDTVTDAITGATRYTKRVYLKVKLAAQLVQNELLDAK
jgi:hypothetical protein